MINRWLVTTALITGCAAHAPPPAAVARSPVPAAAPVAPVAAIPPAPQAPEPAVDDSVVLTIDEQIVSVCPEVYMVHKHADEIDPDQLWVVVLLGIADCMHQDAPLAGRSIGVSGDEAPREIIREVLAYSGVDRSRVQATADPRPGVTAITIVAAQQSP